MRVRIISADILSAFADRAVGTKVVLRKEFLTSLEGEVKGHDFTSEKVPGQGYIPMPKSANSLVSAGVGRRTASPEDYVLRVHRGRVSPYLRREKAEVVNSLACVVYTREAYLDDPEVVEGEEEFQRIASSTATHVLVAVLASAGPKAPLTPTRFLSNLAGGNREGNILSADEIRALAVEVSAYDRDYCVVAD